MCGICGIADLLGRTTDVVAQGCVRAMVGSLMHRGPDESGVLASRSAVFGAARLAIRGLTDGKQPFVDQETGVVAVCNGEIDNHHELHAWLESRGRPARQGTDVAVVPGLYLELGESFVERLVGVFALAVWDPRCNRLLLARDRAGERSLFYTITAGTVRFATEVSSLTIDRSPPLTISKRAIGGYLQTGCFLATATPFEEVQKVAPSEIVTIGADQVRRRRYWRWDLSRKPKRPRTEEEFDEVFTTAIHCQTDVDVDYGVFLSGGLDSSLVAAVIRRLRPERRLRAYTIRFDEQSYDEGNYAEEVAKLLGLESVSVLIKPDVFPAEVAKLVRLVGEPLADQAWIPTTLLARRAAQDVKYALVGEGADELFGGYPTYLGAQLFRYYARIPRWARATVRKAVESLPPSDKKVSLTFLLKRFVQGQELDGISRHLLWKANLSPALLERLGVKDLPRWHEGVCVHELLDAVQEIDLETSLAEGLLTKLDRGSMSSALELRSPFLDQAVMEFAATLLVNERVRGFKTKVFLKRFAQRYLPTEIVHRRKRGLTVPLSVWLAGPLYEWANARLRSTRLDDVGIDSKAAADLLAEHRRHVADHARALWSLIVLSEWLNWVSEVATY